MSYTYLDWGRRNFELNDLPQDKHRLIQADCLEWMTQADERFDLPGGGFLNLDIFKKAVDAPDATPIQIIGEGCFHQFHGGTTTNTSGSKRDDDLALFKKQYEDIHGNDQVMSKASFLYMGHMPTPASNISAVERRRARLSGNPLD